MKSKTNILAAAVVLLVSFSCRDNAVREYGDTLVKGKNNAHNAAIAADIDAIRKAIEAHRAEKGAPPSSIEDLERVFGRPIDRTAYMYNSATGEITGAAAR